MLGISLQFMCLCTGVIPTLIHVLGSRNAAGGGGSDDGPYLAPGGHPFDRPATAPLLHLSLVEAMADGVSRALFDVHGMQTVLPAAAHSFTQLPSSPVVSGNRPVNGLLTSLPLQGSGEVDVYPALILVRVMIGGVVLCR